MRNTVALIAYTMLSLTSTFAQAPFYQGKTITLIQGTSPGGASDMMVKVALPFPNYSNSAGKNLLSVAPASQNLALLDRGIRQRRFLWT